MEKIQLNLCECCALVVANGDDTKCALIVFSDIILVAQTTRCGRSAPDLAD